MRAAGEGAREFFPDEEGTETTVYYRKTDQDLVPANFSPMKRGLKLQHADAVVSPGHPREFFPDEEGTETLAWEPLKATLGFAREFFPDEEGTETAV